MASSVPPIALTNLPPSANTAASSASTPPPSSPVAGPSPAVPVANNNATSTSPSHGGVTSITAPSRLALWRKWIAQSWVRRNFLSLPGAAFVLLGVLGTWIGLPYLQWTSAKDWMEYCTLQNGTSGVVPENCRETLNKELSPPPWMSWRWFSERKPVKMVNIPRSLTNLGGSEIKSFGLVVGVLLCWLLTVYVSYMLGRRSALRNSLTKPRRRYGHPREQDDESPVEMPTWVPSSVPRLAFSTVTAASVLRRRRGAAVKFSDATGHKVEAEHTWELTKVSLQDINGLPQVDEDTDSETSSLDEAFILGQPPEGDLDTLGVLGGAIPELHLNHYVSKPEETMPEFQQHQHVGVGQEINLSDSDNPFGPTFTLRQQRAYQKRLAKTSRERERAKIKALKEEEALRRAFLAAEVKVKAIHEKNRAATSPKTMTSQIIKGLGLKNPLERLSRYIKQDKPRVPTQEDFVSKEEIRKYLNPSITSLDPTYTRPTIAELPGNLPPYTPFQDSTRTVDNVPPRDIEYLPNVEPKKDESTSNDNLGEIPTVDDTAVQQTVEHTAARDRSPNDSEQSHNISSIDVQPLQKDVAMQTWAQNEAAILDESDALDNSPDSRVPEIFIPPNGIEYVVLRMHMLTFIDNEANVRRGYGRKSPVSSTYGYFIRSQSGLVPRVADLQDVKQDSRDWALEKATQSWQVRRYMYWESNTWHQRFRSGPSSPRPYKMEGSKEGRY